MTIFNEQQTKFEGAKFQYGDVKKVYEALQANNVSPEGIPTAAKQFFQSMDRLIGLSPEEKEQKMEQLGEAGLGNLSHFFATSGAVDIKGLSAAMDKLPNDKEAEIARIIGGPRNVVAALAASSWTNRRAQVPNSPLMPKPSNAMELAAVQKEQADLALQNTEAPDETKMEFSEAQRTEADYIARNPEKTLPWHQRGWSKAFIGKVFPFAPDEKENAAVNTYGRKLLRQARLLGDIDSGKIKATPAQRKAVMDSMAEIRESIDSNDGGRWDDPSDTLTKLLKGGKDTQDVLGGIKDDDEFIRDNASRFDRKRHIADDRTAAPIFDRANRVYNDLTGEHTPVAPNPAPTSTTRPSPLMKPMSVNYHIRQTNYGYGYDSIGAVEQHPNNFG